MSGFRALLAGPTTFEGDKAALQALVDIINEAYTYGEGDIFRDGFQRATPEEVKRLAQHRQLILVINPTGRDGSGGGENAVEEQPPLVVEDTPGSGEGEDWQRLVTASAVVGCMKLIVHEPEAGAERGSTTASPKASGRGDDEHVGNETAQQGEEAEGVPLSLAVRRLRRGEVGMFAMHRDFRSQGVGRRLFDAAEARAKAIGCNVCELQLLYPHDRPHAIKDRLRRWYTRRGYSVVATADFCAAFPRVAALVNGRVCFDIYHKPLQ